jgi:hypothetical protein
MIHSSYARLPERDTYAAYGCPAGIGRLAQAAKHGDVFDRGGLRTMTLPRYFSIALSAGVATLAFTSGTPAMAAYCGSYADTNLLEHLALSHGASDVSRIMDIVVVEDYARVDIQSKGLLTEYYVKDCGKWRFSGYALPEETPSAVAAQLSAFVTRDKGGTQCVNPGFVNHPSGP